MTPTYLRHHPHLVTKHHLRGYIGEIAPRDEMGGGSSGSCAVDAVVFFFVVVFILGGIPHMSDDVVDLNRGRMGRIGRPPPILLLLRPTTTAIRRSSKIFPRSGTTCFARMTAKGQDVPIRTIGIDWGGGESTDIGVGGGGGRGGGGGEGGVTAVAV